MNTYALSKMEFIFCSMYFLLEKSGTVAKKSKV